MVGQIGGRWTADKKRRKNFVLGSPKNVIHFRWREKKSFAINLGSRCKNSNKKNLQQFSLHCRDDPPGLLMRMDSQVWGVDSSMDNKKYKKYI